MSTLHWGIRIHRYRLSSADTVKLYRLVMKWLRL